MDGGGLSGASDAADALMHAAPLWGPVVVVLCSTIAVLALYVRSLYKDVVGAKEAHIQDLKFSIGVVHDLRETVLSEIRARRGRV